jgi:ABC-type polysaccharide/polyol phosphate export permease
MIIFKSAISDLTSGFARKNIWMALGWFEIQQRYRRSVIGPFWLTLSMGIMIAAMGPLYGTLFGLALSNYFVYLASGIILWNLIASLVTDFCNAFIGAQGYITQINLPYSIYIYRVIWKNIIVFLHNIVVFAVLIVFFPIPISWNLLLSLVGLIIVLINLTWLGILLAMICARFRDFTQIVASVMGIAFFLTPIFWDKKTLINKTIILDLNPFYHLIEIMRSPLLGGEIQLNSWIFCLVMSIFGIPVTVYFFGKYRTKIPYWL